MYVTLLAQSLLYLLVVHRYYTQGDLDFSTRFLSAVQSVLIDMKTTAALLCDKCKNNEVQIYSDLGDCWFLVCWY